MGFSDNCVVVVEELDDKNWKVRQAFSYTGERDTVTVEVGQETDFASVPRVFVWFLPRYGRYTKAAILHDHLWRDLASTGQMDFIDADGMFRRAMRELEVPFLKRWIMWAAVRWGALVKPRGRRRWWREAPRVLLVTIFAVPFVLPAGAVILASLLAFTIFEGIVWVPLKLTEMLKRRFAKKPEAVKQVNAPAFEWRAG
jgi:uncharacterized protein DUF1353